jgi:hypothetical protein
MRDIERELVELGARLDVPGSADPSAVAVAVRARLEAPAAADSRDADVWWTGRGVWLAAAGVLVIALAAAFTISPTVRAAAGDLLRFAGVEVTWGQPAAPVTPLSPLPAETESSLDEARNAVDFEIGVPAELGQPTQVFVSDGGRVVSLLYDGAAPVRLDEFDGTLDPVFVKTTLADAQQVALGSREGLWVPEPHDLVYVTDEGEIVEETARLSGQTLIWEAADGVSYRLEGDLSLGEAVVIAMSVR